MLDFSWYYSLYLLFNKYSLSSLFYYGQLGLAM